MAITLIKAGLYLIAGFALTHFTALPPWGSYILGCWCGANAMAYIISWAMMTLEAKKQQLREKAAASASVIDFLARRTGDGATTH